MEGTELLVYITKGEILSGAYPIKHLGVANQSHWDIIGQAGAGPTKDIFVPEHSDASKLSSQPPRPK